ncbi:MAG TPA: NEW3 domain-containing protein, partial [Candidatus Hydrogenedentes bacterium]|nr:NEW3 domain-containing protein [Candidatus Hydrogenedentota bacterium]
IAWTEPYLLEDRDHLYGVNLDFIRYPDDSPCSCAACRALYKQWLGREEVTEEDLEDEEFARRYADMRNAVIGGMVAKVRAMCDRVGLKLSVCVFANLHHARMLGQDWPRWAREGLVDVVCPMSYTSDRAQHRQWLGDHITAMNGEAELWDAVARKWDRGENSPDEALAQSLQILREGAHGLASYNMAAFSEEDWQLQAVLQKERGWTVSLHGDRLDVAGPPFAWMRLPLKSVAHAVASGAQLTCTVEDDRVIVRGPALWTEPPARFSSVAPGQRLETSVARHNRTLAAAAVRITGRLPEGWRIEEPRDDLPLAAGESQTVAVAIRVPESASPGRYWLDLMSADTKSGRPVARPLDPVTLEVEGNLFTVLPLTGTRFTSAPTWIPVDVVGPDPVE